MEPTSDELIHAYQPAHRVIELITTYRRGLEVQQAVDATPPSAAHPSTAGRIPTDAAHDGRWVEQIRKRLPEFTGGQTTGVVYDRDGTEFRTTSGRESDISERVRLTLHNSEVFVPIDSRGAPAVFTHVEAKYAQRMRDIGQTYGIVVLNRAICDMERGCGAAVRAILPRGSVLVVWEPGATKPIELHGEARP
ncbi:DddA-like double-stranded DNA deaminase toxin [Saccharopolyspora hattusasensis]|uniref:DddA-like double-stranded DNA deaminase toxin n=1 Tax=Saccharopolyspora hattusasensis TaxID=1128679 RepID=UPI003D96CFBF